MSVYSRLCHWIDEGWKGPPSLVQYRRSSLATLLPAFLFALLTLMLGAPAPILWIGWMTWAGWTGFVAWRGWLMFRDFTRVADRQYDRQDKFKLAPEYWETESATATSSRKKKSKHG